MDFVAEVTDLGAPEYVVTGIAKIERLSVGMVRITKYIRRTDGNFVTHHEVWDYHLWQLAIAPYGQAANVLSRMAIPDGPQDAKRQH